MMTMERPSIPGFQTLATAERGKRLQQLYLFVDIWNLVLPMINMFLVTLVEYHDFLEANA